MTIKAYVDESGDGQPPVLVLAGWIATVTQWVRFSDDWELLRRSYRVSALHMDDAMKLDGEFRGWSELRRNEFLTQAQRMVNEHIGSGVAHALPLQEFAAAVRAEPRMH